MKKRLTEKLISTVLCAVLILSTLTLVNYSSFALTSGDWKYTLSDGKATLTEYIGDHSLKSITVPSKVSGYTVVGLGDRLFENGIILENIYLPDCIEHIGNLTFSFCCNLNNLTLPKNLISIGSLAFEKCFNFTNIKIPEKVRYIDNYAFIDCWSLEVITIPDSVIEIGDYAYGYYYHHGYGMEKMSDSSIIFGVPGSAAEDYADEHGIDFYEIGTFPDVKEGQWYYNAVKYVAQKGYITGFSNGRFGPSNYLKRQDFVCILARIAKADLTEYENVQGLLKDVKKGDYYASAVNWAVDNKIISGYKNKNFGVGDNITREQVCAILYNYIKERSEFAGGLDDDGRGPEEIIEDFKDANKVSVWALPAVAWAVENGIITGKADGRIAPTEGASRAEIAAIIQRMDQQGMFDKMA